MTFSIRDAEAFVERSFQASNLSEAQISKVAALLLDPNTQVGQNFASLMSQQAYVADTSAVFWSGIYPVLTAALFLG